MTDKPQSNRARTRAIRARMAATGEPWSVAARHHDQAHATSPAPARRDQEQHAAEQPPVLVPITTTWCEPGCDGSPHPGRACRTWYPFRDRDRPVSAWSVCQAAALPHHRARSLCDRYLRQHPSAAHTWTGTEWLLGLVYAMLLDDQPDTAPDPRALRAAVEADDLAGVDQLMQPLDRAAVNLVGVDADSWRTTVHPRLSTFTARVLDTSHPPHDLQHCDDTALEIEAATVGLAQRWHQAQQKRWNPATGYQEREPLIWHETHPALDEVLLGQTGGHSRGTLVDVDGRRMRIAAPIWGPAGPPIAYHAMPVDAPLTRFEWERCDAADCRPM